MLEYMFTLIGGGIRQALVPAPPSPSPRAPPSLASPRGFARGLRGHSASEAPGYSRSRHPPYTKWPDHFPGLSSRRSAVTLSILPRE